MLQIEAGVAKMIFERVVGIFVFPRADKAGKPCERFGVERKRLADFARGRLAAIGDDVRGHRRAEFAVALVDVLNRALALVAARQDRDRCRAIRRALRREIARRAAPCRPDRPR